jgi:hypothetical protein
MPIHCSTDPRRLEHVDASQPAGGADPDDTLQLRGEVIKAIDGQPVQLELMTWRQIFMPLLKGAMLAAIVAIPVAFLVTALIGFFVGVVFDGGFNFWACVRWTYLIIFGGGNFLTMGLALGLVGWRAIRQRTPFRLMYEAIIVHKLYVGRKAAFKACRRGELENLVATARARDELLDSAEGALLAGFLGRRGRR